MSASAFVYLILRRSSLFLTKGLLMLTPKNQSGNLIDTIETLAKFMTGLLLVSVFGLTGCQGPKPPEPVAPPQPVQPNAVPQNQSQPNNQGDADDNDNEDDDDDDDDNDKKKKP
ncbi:hypothetical protein NG798_06315 [Ancylothrix sp. C2]|uniref:hypothetical protein n=1 Tax=Ancylothrix sp. D3o TaxID=2953691 RepID=UPI0021BBB47D|nr:hypothetical protein [Ancylothrix sp. D3o]MCT7949393.1 hypothetical protein [Ancylothrix sp. D3o]